jgi:hypothetical protein
MTTDTNNAPDLAVTAALPPVPQPETCNNGHDWMEQLGTAWLVLTGYKNGRLIGDWPLVVVACHQDVDNGRYGIAVWSEGSVEVRGYTTAAARNADIHQYAEGN